MSAVSHTDLQAPNVPMRYIDWSYINDQCDYIKNQQYNAVACCAQQPYSVSLRLNIVMAQIQYSAKYKLSMELAKNRLKLLSVFLTTKMLGHATPSRGIDVPVYGRRPLFIISIDVCSTITVLL